MSKIKLNLRVGRIGTREYNVANVVCDVEHFLGLIHFESNHSMLRESAEVCQVALLSVVDPLTACGDTDAIRLGTKILAICSLLDCAAKVSDDPNDNGRLISILRVCRAALSFLLIRSDHLVTQGFDSISASDLDQTLECEFERESLPTWVLTGNPNIGD